MNPFPAEPQYPLVSWDKMTAGGAGVSVAMIVKPLHFFADAVFADNFPVIGSALFFSKAGRRDDVKPAAGEQIAGQDFLRNVI